MPTGPREARPDDRLRIEPQMCNCTSGNLEIPGLVLTHHPGTTVSKSQPRRCMPASIRTTSPVMLLEGGVARKHKRPAISSAVEATLSGTLATTESRTCAAPAAPRPLVNHGVSI